MFIIYCTDGCVECTVRLDDFPPVGSTAGLDDFPIVGSKAGLDDFPLVDSAAALDDFPLPSIEPRFLGRPPSSLATIPTKLSEVLK